MSYDYAHRQQKFEIRTHNLPTTLIGKQMSEVTEHVGTMKRKFLKCLSNVTPIARNTKKQKRTQSVEEMKRRHDEKVKRRKELKEHDKDIWTRVHYKRSEILHSIRKDGMRSQHDREFCLTFNVDLEHAAAMIKFDAGSRFRSDVNISISDVEEEYKKMGEVYSDSKHQGSSGFYKIVQKLKREGKGNEIPGRMKQMESKTFRPKHLLSGGEAPKEGETDESVYDSLQLIMDPGAGASTAVRSFTYHVDASAFLYCWHTELEKRKPALRVGPVLKLTFYPGALFYSGRLEVRGTLDSHTIGPDYQTYKIRGPQGPLF